jgi:protein-L-isoaspartate(D-aspartate) O-methyltransferase
MTKDELIEELMAHQVLRSALLIRAFQKVDRRHFVLPEWAAEAYGDYPLSIGFGQTISQPLTVAFMLELLAPKQGDHILEVGAGSGWQAALLGYAVSEGGVVRRHSCPFPVIAMERILPLSELAEKNIRRCAALGKNVVKVVTGDGVWGYPPCAPYDRIISAATTVHIPVAWKEQVRVGGRIVAPIEDTIEVHDKLSAHDYNVRVYHGFRFVPLVTDEKEGDS